MDPVVDVVVALGDAGDAGDDEPVVVVVEPGVWLAGVVVELGLVVVVEVSGAFAAAAIEKETVFAFGLVSPW